MQVECVWNVGAKLGEGPLWDAGAHTLWFTDIKDGKLHRFDPLSRTGSSFAIRGEPSFIVPRASGGYLIGTLQHILGFDGAALTGDEWEIDTPAHNRTNDAAVGPDGRLWFGTMDNGQSAPTGAVHMLARDGTMRTVVEECAITNGPAISPDGVWLYHVDTLAQQIWRFRITEDGLTDRSLFAEFGPHEGYPDGAVCDSAGNVWVGVWGAACVQVFAPDGAPVRRIAIPAANVTKVAFGGDDLKTVYVTSARIDMSDEDRARYPDAGGLFAFETDVPGCAPAAVIGV